MLNQKGFTPILFLIFALIFGLIVLGNNPNATSNTSVNLVNPTSGTTQTSATDSAKLASQKLAKYLTVEAALLGVNDQISIYYEDLNSSSVFSINPERSWIPASTIKTFVMLEAFRQRRFGMINFDQAIDIKAQNVVPTELETDEYPRLRVGVKATIRQLVEAMITQSDNTAYNTLLDVLDRRNINNYLREIGITETVVGEKLNLDNDQFQTDLAVAGRQPNTTTAKDLATVFQLLYHKQLTDSEDMLAILKRQKINNMIPALLPENTVVAHKTGDWAPIYHDAGVVYRSESPYVLSVFTHSNNPEIIAKIARVSFFQNATSIGQSLDPKFKALAQSQAKTAHYYLAEESREDNVLGVNDQKFPTITAADLGITAKDLNIGEQNLKKIPNALITPASVLYPVKIFIENLVSSYTKTGDQRTDNLLNSSENRLSEAKTLFQIGDFEKAKQVLNTSEEKIQQAAILSQSQTSSQKSQNILRVKQLTDLQFAQLSEVAEKIKPEDKEQFVDLVYDLYQKDTQTVKPIIKETMTPEPVEQQPAIGTVQEVKDNKATLKFDDGTEREMVISKNTPVREFHNTELDQTVSLKTGEKVAVIGQTSKDNEILPQFILRNVPPQLPNNHQGTVIDIKPQDGTFEIKDSKGNKQEVKVGDETVIKSKDTNVSLEGIKAGSQVTIYGETNTSTPSASVKNQVSTPSSSVKTLSSAKPSASVTPKASTTPTPVTTIKAVSVTVTKNSSGASEKKDPTTPTAAPTPSPAQNKPTAPPKKQDTATPSPAKPEEKKPTPKDSKS